jgi:hypothetical protein
MTDTKAEWPAAPQLRGSVRGNGSASADRSKGAFFPVDYAIVLGPAEIIERLNREIKAGLEDPVMKARFADLGATTQALSPLNSASSSPTKPRSGPRSSERPISSWSEQSPAKHRPP